MQSWSYKNTYSDPSKLYLVVTNESFDGSQLLKNKVSCFYLCADAQLQKKLFPSNKSSLEQCLLWHICIKKNSCNHQIMVEEPTNYSVPVFKDIFIYVNDTSTTKHVVNVVWTSWITPKSESQNCRFNQHVSKSFQLRVVYQISKENVMYMFLSSAHLARKHLHVCSKAQSGSRQMQHQLPLIMYPYTRHYIHIHFFRRFMVFVTKNPGKCPCFLFFFLLSPHIQQCWLCSSKMWASSCLKQM